MSHEVSGFPLSPQQARLWRQQRAAGGVFRSHLLVAVDGALPGEVLEAALSRVVARHEILRTLFQAAPGMALPLQVIAEPEAVSLRAAGEAATPDLETGPVLRAEERRLDDGRRGLLLSLPALCADAETLDLLLAELAAALADDGYGAAPGGGPDEDADGPLQYADLAGWQTELLESADTADGRDYWLRLELPPLPAAPQAAEGAGGFTTEEAELPLDGDLLSAVEAVALDAAAAGAGSEDDDATADATAALPEDVVLAAWIALLARLGGDSRPLLGRRFDGRRYDELAAAPGPLARYLPLAVDASPRRPFRDLVAEVARWRGAAAARQEFVQWDALARQGTAETPPWFPVCFSVLPALAPRRAGDVTLTPVSAEALSDRFELELRWRAGGPRRGLSLAWDPARRRGDEARRLLDRLGVLLAAAVAAPRRALGALPLLTAEDRRRLLSEVNDTAAPRPSHPAVHRLVAEQAARTPRAEAVRDGDGSWTYGELAAAAAVVAAALRRRGVGPETRVAVLAPRRRELMAALLGILEAGGAYVPLEPSAPAARLAWLLADAGVSLLLTDAAQRPEVVAAAAGDGVAVLEIGELLAAPEDASGARAAARPGPEAAGGDALAYVLYTSGSTGRPKGVMVSHRSAVDYLLTAAERYARPGLAVPVHSSVAFDLTVTSLFAPLAVGGWVELLPEESAVESLAALLARDDVELAFVKLTPAHLDAVSRLLPAGPRARVGTLVLGGEALLGETLEPWRGAGEPTVVNEYGPTEATVGCSLYAAPASHLAAGPTSIGGPLPNARLYVADAALEALPEGVDGELLIGGLGVARGYLGRPALTAERFVPDPFSGDRGGRLYRSGDLARRRDDGSLDFLGRVDRQIKLRGHRVEPGEIESALRRAPAVSDAVVEVRPDERGEPRLVAWVATKEGGDAELWRRHLAAELPSYMEPAAFVRLDELPLTANGKVDRAALPAPDWRRGGGERSFEAPRGEIESRLAALWTEVLGVERVGRDDNFFALGGDSILGIQLVGMAAQEGLRFTARQVFQHQTLDALAACVEPAAADAAPAPGGGAESGGESGDDLPLTPAQAWFFAAEPAVPSHFNQALEVAVDEAVTPARLRRAVAAVAAAHAAFGDRYERRGDGWVRHRTATTPAASIQAVPPLAVVDLAVLDAAARRRARRAAADAVQRSLDLGAGPLLRAVLFRAAGVETTVDDAAQRLLLVAHHLAVDGVSWRILAHELEGALADLAAGRAAAPPPEPLSAGGWAARLAHWAATPEALRQARFWSARSWDVAPLAVAAAGGEDGTADTVGAAESLEVSLAADATATLLDGAAAAYGAGADEVLLAALASALAAWSGEARTAVMMEGHGRHELPGGAATDLSRTVGWLTALYPLLFDLTGVAGLGADAIPAEAVADALLRVRQEMRSVPTGGLAFGALLYAAGDDPAADGDEAAERAATLQGLRAAAAAPEVLFNFHGRLGRAASGPVLRPLPAAAAAELGRRQPVADRRPLPLEITAAVAADGRLLVTWTWAGKLFRRADVAAAAGRFTAALGALAGHCASPRADGTRAGGYVPADFPLAALDAADLERLMADCGVSGGRPVEDVYPLSPAQQGILFHSVADPEARLYLDQVSSLLEGPLDAAALRRAWRRLQQRHAVLRTSYHRTAAGEPRAVVWRRAPLPWRQVDLTGVPAARRPELLRQALEADRRAGFDPASAPLCRFVLLRLERHRHRFVWTSHHLLLDGWSSAALLQEVFQLYRAEVGGEAAALPPRRPFRDYVAWLGEQDPAAARRFWQQALEGVEPSALADAVAPAATAPPAAAHDPAAAAEHGERRLRLPAPLTDRLRRVAAAAGLTPYTVVLGAWALLLDRHLGSGRVSGDVVFGTVAAGRPPQLAGSESMIGMLINVLPVRARFAPSQPAVDWLRRLQEEQAAARAYEHAPLGEVQRWCGLDPRRPLFDSLLVFQNYAADAGWVTRAEGESGLRLADAEFAERTNYPVTLVAAAGVELSLRLAFDPRRLDGPAAEALLGRFATLLTALAETPETPLADLPLLPAGELRALALENRTERRWEDDAPVPRRILEQARRTPDAVAVEATGASPGGVGVQLSYAALDALSGRLAARLLAAGVGPESVVAVCLERSPEMIVALLAVLRAGGAYLPLDPEHPAERLAWTLEDAAPAALLVAGPGAAAVGAATAGSGAAAVPRLEVDLAALAAEVRRGSGAPVAELPPELPASAAVYLIYTSGSTGRPKGALNTLGALHNRLWWQGSAFPLGAADRVAQKTPFTFDVSVWELFWPLLTGARLTFAPPGVHRDPAALADWLAAAGVTVSHFVPSMLRAFVAEPRAAGCTALRRVVASGEALDPELVQSFAAAVPGAVLENLYGPTEAAIDVTHHRCDPLADAAGVPIGRPIANLEIHLLDRLGRQVPAGVAAELLIGGAGLARGYRGRPGLTAERFVPHPLAARPGQRLYRSGDLARRRRDGEVEYLGRLDHQLKIRGFRLEPGEIEAELVRHPALAAAAVTPRTAGGDLRLVAWVVPAAGEAAPPVAELRDFLGRTLPAHMVPAQFAVLDALPLTANGKVDRRALADRPLAAGEPAGDGTAAGGRPVAGPVAEIVAGIWKDVLSGVAGQDAALPVLGADADFFALGGHSLLAAQVTSRVRDALGVEVPLALLLAEPTLGRFAERVAALRGGAAVEPVRPLPRDGAGEAPPLSFAQRRLWLESRLAPDSAAYNTTAAPRVHGRFELAAWEQAAAEVVRRHEVLRSRFPQVDGQPVLAIDPPQPLLLPLVDLSRLSLPRRETEARRLLAEQAARPFDLARGRQFRSRLLRLEEELHATPLTLHHIVTDGWSRGILARELSALYDAFRGGRPSPLAELPVQYADYAAWQSRRLASGALDEHLEHWRRRLTPPPPELRLWSREGGDGAPGAQYESELPVELSARLGELARRRGATLYMVLLAGFAALLHRLTGQDDFAVGCAVAGRERRETEELIGFFINMLVLRLDASGSPRFDDLLQRVRQVALDAYAHQELPFDRLVERLRPELGDRLPFQVAFGLDETPGGAPRQAGLTWEEGDVEQVEARFPLTLWWRRRGDRLVCSWAYRSDLFEAAEVAGLARSLQAVLDAMVQRPDSRIGSVELLSEEERERRRLTEEERKQSKELRLKNIRRRVVS